jgi:hypothetical protein
MRGTCERMCTDYEVENRDFTKEVHPFEAVSLAVCDTLHPEWLAILLVKV